MANVAIDPIMVHNWNYSGTTFTLRIFSDRSFVALDDTVVPGRGDANAFYKEYSISVVGTDATIPVVTLASQTDAPNEKNARYMAYFYVDGVEKDMFLANTLKAFQVPDTPVTTEWADLEQYNFGTNHRYYKDERTYSALTIDQKIAASSAANFVDATITQKGVGTVDVPPTIPTAPKFVGDNSPRVNFTVNGKSGPYNLVGDGIADDTVGLNLAWAQTGRIVEIPKGTFKVTSNPPVPVCAQIIGAGRDQTIFAPTSAVTSFLTVKSLTTFLGRFKIDGSATVNAAGIVFGNALVGDAWGGLASQIRVSSFTGSGGVGVRVGDALKAELTGILAESCNINYLFQLFTGGLPTTATLRNCQSVTAVKKGMKIVDGHSITLDGMVVESSGEEGLIVIPTGTAEGILITGGSWFENNYGADATKYQILVDGTSGTAQVDIEDTYFSSLGSKSARFTGSSTRGCSINRLHVPNVAGTVIAEAGVTGTVISWSRNTPTTAFSNAGRTGTTPQEGFEFAQGPYVDWAPIFSSDIGDAAATFNGVVTIAKARFLLIGKELRIVLEWSGTLKAVTPSYIQISLPTTLVTQSSVPLHPGATINNGLRELGNYQPDGASNLRQFRAQTTALYTSAGVVGGSLRTTIELQ